MENPLIFIIFKQNRDGELKTTLYFSSKIIYDIFIELGPHRGEGGKEGNMTDRRRLSFRKGDWIAIALVSVLALVVGLLFVPSSAEAGESVVQVYRDGELLQELPLTAEETLTITGKYENTIVIHGGTVAITRSTCPGEDCVHSGSISRPGRSLVCLPNGLEIRITGQREIDFVVG